MNSLTYQQTGPELLPAAKTSSEIVSELYRSHNSWLQGWLRQKLGNTHDAADLMHDTFSRILQKNDLFTINDPRAFLTTIAHGVLVNHLRRKDLEKAYLNIFSQMPDAEAPSIEDISILIETLMQIDAMLDGLSEKVRNAFLWFQLDGLTHAEIAARLEVSVSSVRQYIAKALMHCIMVTE